MAVRAENTNPINLGVLDAATRVTHFRVSKAGHTLVTRALTAPVNVPANRSFEFPAKMLDLVFPKGQMEDAGIQAAWQAYLNAGVRVDALTDANTVVSAGGYTQATGVNAWTYSTEND